VLVDTCPSQEAFDSFISNPDVQSRRARHGLPEPERVDDYPVHVAFVAGRLQVV
jgi:hypothetical protein